MSWKSLLKTSTLAEDLTKVTLVLNQKVKSYSSSKLLSFLKTK